MQMTNSHIRRFWMIVDIKDHRECWIWRGNRESTGYGRFRIGNRKVRASRIALTLEGPPEPPPPNNHVLHGDCSNKLCVNPAHLRWGSNDENIADKMRLGRQPRGETSAQAKITEDIVRYIRNSGETGVALAAKFSISKPTISLIRNRKIWRHVP